MPEAKRILVLAEAAEETDAFRPVAEKLALDLLIGSADGRGDMKLDFDKRESALRIVEFAQERPLAAIIPVGDVTAPVAARSASMLGLQFHTPKAADACRDKRRLQTRLEAVGLPVSVAGASGTKLAAGRLTVICAMFERQLRALAVFDGEDAVPRPFAKLTSADQQAIVVLLRRLIPALGLKHGPVILRLARQASILSICDVSDSYLPGTHLPELHFRIPLVDEDISFPEFLVRNALGLDTARLYLDVR